MNLTIEAPAHRGPETGLRGSTVRKSAIRILAVDDHPVFRAGISAMLDDQPDLTVVGEASSGAEAVAQHRALNPDVMLLDLQLPGMNGIEVITRVRAQSASARIIVLSAYSGDVLAKRALTAGAQGYVLKRFVRKELLDTIRAVSLGMKRVSADIAADLACHMGDDVLSDREIQVLRLVAFGNSNKRVAGQLAISEETAKGHVKSILGKLNATDRTHAVTLALMRGVIQL
jgi:DNA-binding NarL/FixJ family response regulator